MTESKKPPEPDDLSHHGVKGQRWGVRRERDVAGVGKAAAREAVKLNDDTKEYLSIIAKPGAPLSSAQAAQNLAKNKEKFAQKFGPSVGPHEVPPTGKGLTPRQKKLLIGAAVGVGVVGGLYVYSKYGGPGGPGTSILSSTHPAGEPISASKFKAMVFRSQSKTWLGATNGFITEESLARPAFELPSGHIFHRISTTAESSWRVPPGTYSLSSIEDFHRYAVGFSGEKLGADLHHVTFASTKPIKVPNLPTVLNTIKESMGVDSQGAMHIYNDLSGGSWQGARSELLIDRLKGKGFGAIVDEMDAGVIGEKPLVVFSEHFSGKKSTPITSAVMNTAKSNLTEIAGRK